MPDPAERQIFPIVVVHAVTAAGLDDRYLLNHKRVWSPINLALNDYETVTPYPHTGVKPGEMRYEARQPALVRAGEPFGMIYDELVDDLRDELRYGPIPVQPVYPFAYDWRQDNFRSAEELRVFCDEVIARTNLMPHDRRKVDPEDKGLPLCDGVDIVAHSMGGLVAAACIAGNEAWSRKRVRRVVTLGTPYRGASAALLKLATGTGPLFGPGRERERRMARVTPSVYQLLPEFEGALEGHPATDIWKPETFQPSIKDSIASFIAEVHADDAVRRSTRRCKEEADRVFPELLDLAKKFRGVVKKASPGQLRKDGGWLAIAGAGEKTLIRTGFLTKAQSGTSEIRFRFDEDKDYCPGTGRLEGDLLTGDGTVPLSAAIPPWDEPWRNTIVVTRQDFTFGEWTDKIVAKGAAFHCALPLLNLAQRWIINFVRPEWLDPDTQPRAHRLGQHGNLWGRLAPVAGAPTLPSARKQRLEALQKIWQPQGFPTLELTDCPED